MAFVAILGVSLVSLVGLFSLSFKTSTVHRVVFVLVAFGAGAILGAALFGIIPDVLEEATHEGEDENLERILFALIALGFIAFYALERFLY